MNRLAVESFLFLIRVEVMRISGGLESIHSLVRKTAVRRSRPRVAHAIEELCHSMDVACVFYPKRVLCLQRSAATTLLLRRHGHNAELVIGAQRLPFRSHAWVEVSGVVVNDKPYMLDIYRVLERC